MKLTTLLFGFAAWAAADELATAEALNAGDGLIAADKAGYDVQLAALEDDDPVQLPINAPQPVMNPIEPVLGMAWPKAPGWEPWECNVSTRVSPWTQLTRSAEILPQQCRRRCQGREPYRGLQDECHQDCQKTAS
jgi:hypothetical protein